MPETKPNVVIIAIDSLRASHLGCYGYSRNTSPNIDALADACVVFDRAFAAGIPTMPSFTTMLSGLHPYRHGIVAHIGENQRLPSHIQMLPQIAQRAGWVTVGIDNLVIQGGGRGSWFSRGFDYYSGFLYAPFTNQSEQLTDRACKFITELKDKPFLLFAHLWDPHTPYGPPPPFDTLHYQPDNPSPGDPDLAEVIALAPDYYSAFLGDMKLKREGDYGYVVAQYDGEISYVDVQIGRIIAHLKASGVWDNTVLVLMSDHGEAFGEGDIYFDHHGLYDAVTRIVLMCRTPDSSPARTAAMVSTEDILPTLGALCGWEMPTDYALTGQSFADALSDNSQAFAGRDRIFSVESTRQASLCVRTAQWKLILPLTHDACGSVLPDLHGHERDPAPLLFDLENDPEEKHNVGAVFPDVRNDLLRQLLEWRDGEVARHGHDPVLENGLSLGYTEFMARLTARKHKNG